jgi:hypothetical protein
MTMHSPTLARAASLAIALAFGTAAPAAFAQTQPAKKPAATKGMKKALPVKREAAPATPPADADQIAAASEVYYGTYECEFKQSIEIAQSDKHPSYVDVKHNKADYLMKPVLSSTGAVRLEDVRGNTLMVQISSKSMLLNVRTAQRIVDDCVSPKQRDLIEAARAAKAAETGGSAATTTK